MGKLLRGSERGREEESNEVVGGQGSEGEDGGKKSQTRPPLFLTSKILPVRRNHSPPLKRTALLRHCFIPRSALPQWKLVLIPSEANALVNEAFRGSPSIDFVLHTFLIAAIPVVSTSSLTFATALSFRFPRSERVIF